MLLERQTENRNPVHQRNNKSGKDWKNIKFNK